LEITAGGATDNANLTDLFINNNRVAAFNPDTLVYNFILPQGTTTSPVIAYEVSNTAMNVQTTYPLNILSLVAADRTATLITTSADGLKHQTYKLIFKINGSLSAIHDTDINSAFCIKPNPVEANTMLKLEIASGNDCNNMLSIIDLSGKKVLSTNFNGSDSTVAMSGIWPGMYFVSIQNKFGISTKKLLVY
jgi:hypothetical protein